MKKNIITFFVVAGCLLSSCRQPMQYITHWGTTEGTFYQITYESPKGVDYEKEISQVLHDFSASLSTYLPTSLISRINQNDSTAIVDDYFRTVFSKSAEVNKASDGIFDITIAPIVNLWGFGFTSDEPEMDPKKIDSLLQYVGMDKIRIEGNRVVKDLPGVMLDVNAIAKGYSVDVMANMLRAKGCRNLLVNIGGECVAQGLNEDGNTWRVGIERPMENTLFGESYLAYVHLDKRAMATSGNYRRFFEIDGRKYGHTIDVKTGYPVINNLLSVSVVADDCITADAWATVCLASGLEKSIQILQQHPELEALFIYSDENGDFKVQTTNGMNAVIVND